MRLTTYKKCERIKITCKVCGYSYNIHTFNKAYILFCPNCNNKGEDIQRYINMRKYKTFCVNCGKETRNTKKDFTKPIDYCKECINYAKNILRY